MASPFLHNFEKPMDPLDKHLGEKLRNFRKQASWSLKELADKSGVSHSQIHKYELGYSKYNAPYKLDQ
jgi:transcriptional regulator with XRE-family HTH domain